MNDTHRFMDPSEVLGRIDNWPSTPAKEWVENWLQTWRRNSAIRAVVILGSIVRPRVKYSTDVDLLVIYEKEKPKYPLPPLDVDLRSYRQGDVESLLLQGHELLCWSIRFGKVLYECDGYWTTLCDNWRDRLPFPSARKADERAERAKRVLQDIRVIGDQDAAQEQHITMLTQTARACLIRSGTYPASRPELPDQLKSIGEQELASQLEKALQTRREWTEGQAV